MAGDKAGNVAKEAKGLAADFVQVLGLTELVLGALVLYWFHLRDTDRSAAIFPTSGHVFVDVALLACAAAFTGKAVSLVVHGVMALVERLAIERANLLGYFSGMKETLSVRLERRGLAPAPEIDRIALAERIVEAGEPTQLAALRGMEQDAFLSYGVALLVVPYAATVGNRADNGQLCLYGLVCAVLFAAYGLVRQLDRVQTLRMLLATQDDGPAASGGPT